MKQRLLILLYAFAIFGMSAMAQDTETTSNKPNLRAWESLKAQQSQELSREPIPYVPLTENDIAWSKRVTRDIYLSERMNAPLYYPLVPTNEFKSLFDVVVTAVTIPQGENAFGENTLSAYEDENFTVKLSAEEIQSKLSYTIINKKIDDAGEEFNEEGTGPVEAKMMQRVRIVEDWYFDKSRSEFKVQIVAFTFIYQSDPEKPEISSTFWIYYPEARKYLDNAFAYNILNASQPLTFEELFAKRLFNGIIIKEENIHNRMIAEYEKTPEAQLLEARKISNGIRDFEMELWTY